MPESTAAQPITEDLKTLLWLAQGVFAQTLKRSNSSARPKTLDHAKERAQNDCMPESQCTLCRSELDLPHVMVNISHFGGLSAVLSKLSRLFGTSLVVASQTIIGSLVEQVRVLLIPILHGLHRRLALEC